MLERFSKIGPYDVGRDNYQRMRKAAETLRPKLEELRIAREKREAIEAEEARKEKLRILKEKQEARKKREEARRLEREKQEKEGKGK